LLETEGTAWAIATELRRAEERPLPALAAKAVHEAITDLGNNGERMNYAAALPRRRGLRARGQGAIGRVVTHEWLEREVDGGIEVNPSGPSWRVTTCNGA
jgi:hypothetical protein